MKNKDNVGQDKNDEDTLTFLSNLGVAPLEDDLFSSAEFKRKIQYFSKYYYYQTISSVEESDTNRKQNKMKKIAAGATRILIF